MDKELAAIVVVALSLIGLAGWAAYAESEEWQKFSKDHSCKVVAHIRGDTFNTISADGKIGIGSTPDKTGYLCDDGMTYYR